MTSASTEQQYLSLPLDILELTELSFEQFYYLTQDDIDKLSKIEGLKLIDKAKLIQVWTEHPKRQTQTKKCTVEWNLNSMVITFTNQDLDGQIQHYINKSKAKKGRDYSFDNHQLCDGDGNIYITFSDLNTDIARYYYKLPTKYPAVSASYWTDDYVSGLLNIDFDDHSDEVFNLHHHTLSDAAQQLLDELDDLTNLTNKYNTKDYSMDNIEALRSDSANEKLKNPMMKLVYAVQKYSTNEALVDSFLSHLLYRLGFYDDWLLPIPQHSFPLYFGDIKKEAICDFCVLDVLSFAVMAIAKDKSHNNQRVNSEGQLMAEILGAIQHLIMNKKKRNVQGEVVGLLTEEERTCFGLRVNGLVFHFYQVKVSDQMLEAMRKCEGSNTKTKVFRKLGLNVTNKTDLITIVSILDKWCSEMKEMGTRSKQQPSV